MTTPTTPSSEGGDGWQPISTVDWENDVMLFDPDEKRIYIAHFEAWYEPEWVDQDGNHLFISPTHWMPIPKPPSPSQRTGVRA